MMDIPYKDKLKNNVRSFFRLSFSSKLSFCLIPVALILYIAGLATDSWLRGQEQLGLYSYCQKMNFSRCCSTIDFHLSTINRATIDFIDTAEGFQYCGFTLACFAVILMTICTFVPCQIRANKILRVVIEILLAVASVMVIIGSITYGVEYRKDSFTKNSSLSSSLYLCTVSGCIFVLPGFIHLLESIKILPNGLDQLKRKQYRLPNYWKLHDMRYAGFKIYPEEKIRSDAIENLVQMTWNSKLAGVGRDSQSSGYTKVEIKKIERLENPSLFETYATLRKKLFTKAIDNGAFKSLEQCENIRRGGPLTKNCDNMLNREVYTDINEHYLFHGTSVDGVNAIVNQGLDSRLTVTAMLGKGVYAAESSTKADQYADSATEEKKMLLLRVCLGDIFVINKAESYKRAPCTVCHKDLCDMQLLHPENSPLYDSVVYDSDKKFREFVVYSREYCYPEYIITYVRK